MSITGGGLSVANIGQREAVITPLIFQNACWSFERVRDFWGRLAASSLIVRNGTAAMV